MNVTILGTGRMGSAMAERVAQAGHDVVLWNRDGGRSASLADRLGCSVAPDPASAVTSSSVVLSVLANGAVTEEILLDPAVLASLPHESVVCDMATSGLDTAETLAAAYAAASRSFVDSPVAGSVTSVLSGALLVMASGPESAVARAHDIFSTFAGRVVYLGEAGRGQAMKLSAGLVVHSLNSAVSEGLALATRAGIDPSIAYEVLRSSSVGAPYLGYKEQVFLGADSPVAMSLDLSGKDLALISNLASDLSLELSALTGVQHGVTAARAMGFGSSDMADLYRYLLGEAPPERPTT